MSARTGLRRAARHRIEYAFLRAVAAVCAVLPEVLADRAGALLGWVVARVGRPRWGVVSEHLRMAFPERDERWRRAVGRRCYAHLGAEAVAMFRLAGVSTWALRERTRVVGIELLEAAAREGRGVVVVSAHLGNWEVGGAAVIARGCPMDIVVARQRNELFDRYLTRSRERLGFGIIPRGEARADVLRTLREGRAVGIMGDQDARRGGVFADFFGRPASTARGPAILAMRSGAEMIMLFAIREPGWRPRYTVHLEPLAPAAKGGRRARRDESVRALTRAFTSRIEERVREYPAQYLWLHRRWKTPPPDAAGTDGATRRDQAPSHSM
ncbi:MAG: lysophospholipid acyltransferase family protein [Gemmatimonadetes bacterium]|nr:lysophospholipid acyltransferase family protein [Gemmatimonadota bacterium]